MSPAGKHSCAPHTFRPQRAWLPSSERGAPWGCAEAAAARLTFPGIWTRRGQARQHPWTSMAVPGCVFMHMHTCVFACAYEGWGYIVEPCLCVPGRHCVKDLIHTLHMPKERVITCFSSLSTSSHTQLPVQGLLVWRGCGAGG